MMASTVKISFILPVYNVKEYLQECLDSICTQVQEKCEVITVDDGATDGSGAICDAYAQRYDFVHVIHKENGGLSSARNAGLEAARGKYIAFVDADDRVAYGCVDRMLAWAEESNADICFMQVEKFYPDGRRENLGDHIQRAQVVNRNAAEVLSHLASRPKFPGSACSKLYRRDFLKENQLHFPYDRRYSEDLGFARDCFLKANKFDVLEFPYYEYRKGREGSITSVRAERNFWDLSLFVEESEQRLTENKKAKDRASQCAMGFAAYEYMILLWYCSSFNGDARRKAHEFLRRNRWVLTFGVTWKMRLVYVLTGLVGLRGTGYLLNCYMKLRSYTL